MFDETTAVYDVLIADNYAGATSGQLLVILAPGTAQPNPMQQWKVEIHRPMLVENGMGVEQKLAAVRFLKYVELPRNPGSKQPAFSEPAKPASAPDQTVPGPSDTPADPPTPDQQRPASTERVAPSPDQP